MRALLPVLIALAATPAAADRVAPSPPQKRMPPQTPDQRIRELEQRVADLERQLAEAKAQLAKTAPPVAMPPRRGLDKDKAYRVPLDDSPSIGPSLAPITIVAAVQFPEPFTHRAWPTLKEIVAKHRDVRIVFKNYIVHPKHTRSSIAACAAGMQGEIEQFEELLFAAAQQQQDPNQFGLREILDGEAREIARTLRVNMKQYDRDLQTCEAGHKRDQAMLGALGQNAVPVFWINGRPLSGAMPIEEFAKVIDEERAKWKTARAGGAKLEGYYERVTTAKPNPY